MPGTSPIGAQEQQPTPRDAHNVPQEKAIVVPEFNPIQTLDANGLASVKDSIRQGIAPDLILDQQARKLGLDTGLGEMSIFQRRQVKDAFEKCAILHDPKYQEVYRETYERWEKNFHFGEMRQFIKRNFHDEGEQQALLEELEYTLRRYAVDVVLELGARSELANDPYVRAYQEFKDIFYNPNTSHWEIPVQARMAYFLFRKAYIHYHESGGDKQFQDAWNDLEPFLDHFPLVTRVQLMGMAFERRLRVLGRKKSSDIVVNNPTE